MTTYLALSRTMRRTAGLSAATMASESTLRKSDAVSGVFRALSKRALTCAPSKDDLWCFFAIVRFLSAVTGPRRDCV